MDLNQGNKKYVLCYQPLTSTLPSGINKVQLILQADLDEVYTPSHTAATLYPVSLTNTQ